MLGLEIKSEVPVDVIYDETDLGVGYRLDILVNDKVVIELKSVKALEKIHHKQLFSYLKLSGKKCGLLINFNEVNLQNGIYRQVN